MRWILLPGLDGTGGLFQKFLEAVPSNVTTTVIAYPNDRVLDRHQLCNFIEENLDIAEPYILIAESFSGPFAIALADKGVQNLKAIVLCATFIHRPLSRAKTSFAELGKSAIFKYRPPKWVIKHYLLDEDTPEQIIQQFYAAISLVSPKVLSERVRMALEVDVREEFLRISTPTLWIVATHDKLIRRCRFEGEIGAKKNVRIKEVAAPHFVLQRRPAEVVQHINEFIEQAAKA